MDQQNTLHRASLILQTRSQDLDPGKAQRGNLSRKQNRKSKKQRARKTKEQELRRELDQNSSTAEEADKSQKKNTQQQGPWESLPEPWSSNCYRQMKWSTIPWKHGNQQKQEQQQQPPTDRPTPLPKTNQKAKRSVQITKEATFWLQAYKRVSSLCLFVCSRGKKVLLLCGTLGNGMLQSLKGAKSANPNHQHHDNNTCSIPFSILLASRIHARCERRDFIPPGCVARALSPGELKRERKKARSLGRSLAPRKVLFDVLPRNHRPWRWLRRSLERFAAVPRVPAATKP